MRSMVCSLLLLIVVIFSITSYAMELDPLLAEVQGIGIDVKKHIRDEEHHIKLDDVTASPTFSPTAEPTLAPTHAPTYSPTAYPTASPSAAPSAAPTYNPTPSPTASPSAAPTREPTAATTDSPAATPAPSAAPTTATPSAAPTTATPSANPTQTPTATPSATPVPTTATPTAAPSMGATPVISFTSYLSLSNVATSTLDSASQTSVAQSTCISMNIPTTSCGFQSSFVATSAPVSSPTSRRALRSQSEAEVKQGREHVLVFNLVASVETTALVPSGVNSDTYYTTLTNRLTTLVTNGSYTDTLRSVSSQNGATATASASATSVSYTAPVITNPSDDDDKLSDGAIAGIVIGVVVGVALITAIVYFFLNRSRNEYEGTDTGNFNAKLYGRGNTDAPIAL